MQFYYSITIFMITFHYFNSLIIIRNANSFNSLIQISHTKEKVLNPTMYRVTTDNFHTSVAPARILNLASAF